MKRYGMGLGIMGLVICGILGHVSEGNAQTAQTAQGQPMVNGTSVNGASKVIAGGKEWHVHPAVSAAVSGNRAAGTSGMHSYHRKPALYPAKRKQHNPLRKQGWHTHPDPYIEEGGAYTHEAHPALTDTQGTMRDYTTGSPNAYVTPPATVARTPSAASGQQKVHIKDPLPAYEAPISLPNS